MAVYRILATGATMGQRESSYAMSSASPTANLDALAAREAAALEGFLSGGEAVKATRDAELLAVKSAKPETPITVEVFEC